jgi:hypothetical protein
MEHLRVLVAFLWFASVLADGSQPFGKSNSKMSFIDGVQNQPNQKQRNYAGTKDFLHNGHTPNISLPVFNVLQSQPMKSCVAAFIGTVLTFVLNNVYQLGPVQASGFTSLFVCLVLPEKLAIAAACGSFAGMAKTTVIDGVFASMILGIICAVMMLLFDEQKWLIGVGGRLGFIAQCACTTQVIIASLFRGPSDAAKIVGSYPGIKKLLFDLPSVSLYTVVGAVFMKVWKEILARLSKHTTVLESVYKRLSTTVGAVGATGLIATLLSPASVAGPVFCGSFIAMSSQARIRSGSELVGASILGGVSQQLLTGFLLGGWGGKLGTASLMGVLLYNILLEIKDKVSAQFKKPATSPTMYRSMHPVSS